MLMRTDAPSPRRWPGVLAVGLPVLGALLLVSSVLVERGAQRQPQPQAQQPQIDARLLLTEFDIVADIAEIPARASVTFHVVNEGVLPHDAAFGEIATPMLAAGESASFTVEAGAVGVIELICTVPGHDTAGMRLALPIVEDHASPSGATALGRPERGGVELAASPANAGSYTGPKPPLDRRDPAAPPSPTGTVHDVVWTVEEKVVQVAEGIWQEVWTFDGQAPGPTLRLRMGDTLNLTLRNPAEAQVGHSIDFHASQVAWDDEMRTIGPGEELVYSFQATHAGVFMYHCGTAPALHHIGNAMHGMVIVEPDDGLAPVDHELFFVQHEYYLGPQGHPGDLSKMVQGAPSPDLVVFNGVANQYLDAPIEVGTGERIRAWVLNNGPSIDSSFHVVGTIFDTVVKEGIALSPDNPGGWGSQALDLAPAQGGYVEFSLAEDGLYPIVTHAFNNVGRGALGLFQAGTAGTEPPGGH
jgi:nitrite reductase (NO-forming)